MLVIFSIIFASLVAFVLGALYGTRHARQIMEHSFQEWKLNGMETVTDWLRHNEPHIRSVISKKPTFIGDRLTEDIEKHYKM